MRAVAGRSGLDTLEWLSLAVTFAAGVVLGIVAHRSPKGDWEFITAWPALVMLGVGALVAQAEMVPIWTPGEFEFECTSIPGQFGLPERDCDFVVRGGGFSEPEIDVIGWAGQTVMSMALDVPAEVGGVAIGILAAGGRPRAPWAPAPAGPAAPTSTPWQRAPQHRSLHQEVEAILLETGQALTAEQIAERVRERGHYRPRPSTAIVRSQNIEAIVSRAPYRDRFAREGDAIGLRDTCKT